VSLQTTGFNRGQVDSIVELDATALAYGFLMSFLTPDPFIS
jgi:hypothetical protein